MKLPRSLTRLIESFERLPGIGPKTAQRLTFYLLHFPQEEIEVFAEALEGLKKNTKLCSICRNVSETDICSVCGDPGRDKRTIVVVANPLDSFALERTGFKGTYHVLHGIIDPLNNIGPEEIFIKELIDRVAALSGEVSFENINDPEIIEIIIATNMSMEGESTAMYISKMLRERGLDGSRVKISRIARGLPVGGDVEYADDITLGRALEGRFEIK
ncbi:TPA: recombination protein RecR [candidate division WWE3 bacterium]|uniref:Recombination protein RecR n=1 Tax=candidate division WWE3 bacterium TaxID=2053526 RepID=A0A656PMC3_UNCKA|nr:recombination protein RecR [candidate division WWE3 bacterium RAAC2_WWE3_1]KKS28771.1 MAG: Recombination protein RecR [candidate division WWE3 bacterium GW2011_GWB1_42_117]KKS55082.1 MAG: Recombination protein RecR [candidate division WWE3 bacterium GW2011_GWD2_42_34]KKT04391.1 MAG: Recombination protein RecR [candidate division WWE3 bacterium GW2011_GWE2_43_18]KKT07109.1 MAG: Recombination protein RecR [candidate division WWE3 bacterium GW2011_GWF2_43_18]KKT08664.1 MAG: Recombination prote